MTVYPRYILVNNTEGTLLYNQKGSEQIFFLYPGARLPFHWPDIHRPFLLRIRPGTPARMKAVLCFLHRASWRDFVCFFFPRNLSSQTGTSGTGAERSGSRRPVP